MHVGRYLNGYGRRSTESRPAGPTGTALPTPPTFNYFAWTAFNDGVVSDYPDAAHPGVYQTDFYARKAVELIDDAAPATSPSSSRLSVHRPPPRRPARPRRPAPAAAPPRPRRATATVRGRAAAAPAASTRRDMSDKPRSWPTGRASSPSSAAGDPGELAPGDRGAAGRGRGRRPDRRRAAPHGRARQHADRVHLGQRLHARRAPRPAGRCCSTRSRSACRSSCAARACPGRARHQLVTNVDLTSTILDATGVPPGGRGRALAVRALRDPGAEWGRDLLIESGKARTACPLRASAPTASSTPSTRHGRARALRPRSDPYELQSRDGDAPYAPVQRDLHSAWRRWCTASRGLPGPTAPALVGPLRRPPLSTAASPTDLRSRCAARSERACCTPTYDRPPPRGAPAQHPDRTRRSAAAR